ncbi:MAG: DUF1993 domain-containing protein [Pseudomonadota bacterium]
MSDTISFMLKTAAGQVFPAMAGFLAKGKAHAEATGVEEAVFMQHRLAPNMFALPTQVQIATDILALGGSRIAGVEGPSLPDNETSFDELIARIKTRLEYVQTLDAVALDADPDAVIEFPVGDSTMSLPRRIYLATFLLPNLYFHASTAYGLLRAQGVDIGKRDFLTG